MSLDFVDIFNLIIILNSSKINLKFYNDKSWGGKDFKTESISYTESIFLYGDQIILKKVIKSDDIHERHKSDIIFFGL